MPLPSLLHGRVVPTLQTTADATWEMLTDFKERYLEFQLEDELFVVEEESVVDSYGSPVPLLA